MSTRFNDGNKNYTFHIFVIFQRNFNLVPMQISTLLLWHYILTPDRCVTLSNNWKLNQSGNI